METKNIAHVVRRRVAIGTASNGDAWCGTDAWLVKDDFAKKAAPEVMDNLVARPFETPLSRVYHGTFPMIASTALGVLRPYMRPDGITVWLDELVMEAIEELCEEEDEFGSPVAVKLTARQVDNRRSPVGFFDPDERLAAVVMPVMQINEHLTDGAGRVLADADV